MSNRQGSRLHHVGSCGEQGGSRSPVICMSSSLPTRIVNAEITKGVKTASLTADERHPTGAAESRLVEVKPIQAPHGTAGPLRRAYHESLAPAIAGMRSSIRPAETCNCHTYHDGIRLSRHAHSCSSFSHSFFYKWYTFQSTGVTFQVILTVQWTTTQRRKSSLPSPPLVRRRPIIPRKKGRPMATMTPANLTSISLMPKSALRRCLLH